MADAPPRLLATGRQEPKGGVSVCCVLILDAPPQAPDAWLSGAEGEAQRLLRFHTHLGRAPQALDNWVFRSSDGEVSTCYIFTHSLGAPY